MSKLNYPLKVYIKAVEILALQKRFDRVENYSKGGSVVRFDLFMKSESVPCAMWVVHHEHNKKKIIWSKEDYKKACRYLNATLDEFVAILDAI